MSNPTPVPAPVVVPPSTQSQHPWRATIRTIFAIVVGLASSYGVLVSLLGLSPGLHVVVVGAAIAGAITRIIANPTVDLFLNQYFPWLSATPKVKKHLR